MNAESGRPRNARSRQGHRGRPRSESARQAILAAAADLLLAQGLSSVSMDSIAVRARVSKATIYRWWPTKETLALDALYEQLCERDPEPPDTGDLEGDLRTLLTGWMERVNGGPYARVIGALIARAATDEAFGELYRARYVEPRRAQARAVLRRAIDRGDLANGVDVEAAIDLLYGPVYHRLLHGHGPLTDPFAGFVARTVVAGLRGHGIGD